MPHTKVIWTWTKESLFFIETIQLDMTTPTNNSRVKKLHLKKRLMPSLVNVKSTMLCYGDSTLTKEDSNNDYIDDNLKSKNKDFFEADTVMFQNINSNTKI